MITLTADALENALMVLLLSVLVHIIGLVVMVVRLRNSEMTRSGKGAVLLCATFNNAMFLPVPLVLMFLGDAGIPTVGLFSITQMILLSTAGALIASSYGGADVDFRVVLRKVLLFPPFIAAILGIFLALSGVVVYPIIVTGLDYTGIAASYFALFSVGLGLGARFTISDFRDAVEPVIARQVIVPLIMFLLLIPLELPDITTNVLIIQALMPSAVFTVAYSTTFDLDAHVAATIVTLGTLLFLPVVPLLPLIIGVI